MLSIRLLSVLAVSSATVILGVITLLTNSKSRANRWFFALCSAIAVFNAANYLADADYSRALIWVQTTFALAIVMTYMAVSFINIFPKQTFKSPFGVIAFGVAALMAALSYSPLTVPAVTRTNDITNVVEGPLMPVFLAFFICALILIMIILGRGYRTTRGHERLRALYLMIGFGATGISLAITNMIIPILTGSNDASVLGVIAPIFFVGAISISIVRHRLFNIRLVVARSATYLLLLASMATMYGGASLIVSQYFFATSRLTFAQEAVNTAFALVLAFAFQPLRRFFEHITDKIFYRDRYDSQVVLNDLSQIFVSELHIERILKKSVTALCESLHIQFAQIIVFKDDRVYKIEHYGPLPQRLMVAPELRRLNRTMLIADELNPGERKGLLDRHGVRVSMMLSTREQFIGYLLLGDKLSGDIYSNQDVEVLEIIGKELAVAILNARAYAEIEAFNQHLQERIDHATQRLRVANRHLKELDRVKDEFISMASHQLRTPLTTIKGYLSMMLEGDVGPIPDQQREFVNYAFTSSERMVNLISDLLNVSRLQAGRFIIMTKPTDMVKMIQEEVHQLDSHAKAKNLRLVFDPPGKILPEIEIDENKTRQVIMNFIDNAIYYTQKGEVRVILEQSQDHVRLLVKDSGIGVPKEAQKKLFSKFFRAGNAQIVRPDGTGLGLYLAKRVVEDQGGTIIFDSVEGKGSTFGFELPVKPKPITKEGKHGRHASRQ